MKRHWLLLGFLLALPACSGNGETAGADEKVNGAAAEAPATVTVVPVTIRPLGAGVSASGLLVAREEAAVGPELSGFRVLRVLADEGDTVRRGQPLAVLDGALLEGEAARAQANVAAARIAAERARSEYGRVSDLTGRGVIADETIAARGFEARATQAQLRVAEVAVAEIGTRRARLTLRAPVAGLVVQRSVRPGDVSGAGGEAPFRIARDGLLELDAEVPERAFGQLRVRAPAIVTLASGERLDGQVRLLGTRVDPATRLGRVRIRLPQNRALRLGGFASASLGGGGAPVPSVPERAVAYDGGAHVLTVDDRGVVARIPVRTGTRAGGWVELAAGPPPSTRVIAGGAGLVGPGERVRAVAGRP